MNRITVSLTDAKRLELTQLASEQGTTLGRFCSTLLNTASLCLKTTQIAAPIDPDEAGDYAPLPQIAAECVAPPPPVVPQCVATAQIAAPSLDVTVDERAAHAAKRAEADQKRRTLFAAMGVTHPADAPLPAKFIPGEADFLKAHPDLA